MSLEGDILKITRNGTATSIDLSKYLDNENTQLTTEEVKNIIAAVGYVKVADLQDDDANNEIQDLLLEGDILKITRNGTASSIDLSKYLDNENTQLTTEEVKNIIAAVGYLKVADLQDDDANNEIQDLSLEGDILKITRNGSATSIDLSGYLDNTTLTPIQVDAIVTAKGYIKSTDIISKADIDSPTFTGSPILPPGTTTLTHGTTDISSKFATTAYVHNIIAEYKPAYMTATIYNEGLIRLSGNLTGSAEAPMIKIDGNQKGDLMYYNGYEWGLVPAGGEGQVL
ncbi:hypothetical protein K4L44_10665 [Halosquirtibacter laminarini]|uniref:Uncharacterized protein n=1 Tax=Halosquirtibacter laminarini TaxID=3374600 RepID=A0AC61NI83_9BACT|nr:hypothetical protein K4L44_10665 [Prolixibacteraceae bacterium]